MYKFKEIMPVNNEESIVDTLFKNVKKVEDCPSGWRCYSIEYGNKNLYLHINMKTKEASSLIENTEGERIENQTTIIYKALKKFLEEFSDENKIPIAYKFETENEEMKKWAHDRGSNIFECDEDSFNHSDDGKSISYSFKKTFLPKVELSNKH